MRHIDKQPVEPPAFRKWKEKANEDWQPDFDAMPSEIKRELKRALTCEQLGICCYCESKLSENDSHIEHFRPQKTYKDLSLDYQNMLCSCQSNLKKGDPRHCGNAKGNWFDEELMISPLAADCASHFRYTGDGNIYPANEQDEAARETIKHLALNSSKLVESRKEVLAIFLDEDITDEEFQRFGQRYLKELSADNPPEYISAISDVILG